MVSWSRKLDAARLIPVVLCLLVLISGTLLALSLESTRLLVISMLGAVLGFLCVDVFKLFQIRGVWANLASLVILVLAMRDFFPGDSTGKLVAVANLLVYLQTVLMFQQKTRRLNWQVLVLSLLQAVVAAIFSFTLETGLLFLAYFVVACLALLVQSFFTNQQQLRSYNTVSTNLFRGKKSGELYAGEAPLVFFSHSDPDKSVNSILAHLFSWIMVSFLFTFVMFFVVPHDARPWFRTTSLKVTSQGIFRQVNLDKRGLVERSNTPIFQVQMMGIKGEPIDLESNIPYFRSMALGNLELRDGATSWGVPHGRITDEVHQYIDRVSLRSNLVLQKIRLEENVSPTVYGVMPFFRHGPGESKVVFCHEASTLTRAREGEMIDRLPFDYEGYTLLDANARFANTWPYIPNTRSKIPRAMSDDRLQMAWLTEIDPERYPTLVAAATRIQDAFLGVNRIDLLKEMESYFQRSGKFRYTLDFRNVPRQAKLDPVEDFFANHHQGHCELYASALTLMLRSQGIPARYVIGFHGAERNPITDRFIVKGRHAHAWVEAYLRPQDCTSEMVEQGIASGLSGAWLRLDPTPPSNDNGGVVDTISLARTVWQDLVLGNDSTGGGHENGERAIWKIWNHQGFRQMQTKLNWANQRIRTRWFRQALFAILATVLLWQAVLILRNRSGSEKKVKPSPRNWVASLVGLVSPKLADRLRNKTTFGEGRFYQQMLELLKPHQMVRAPEQTQREFVASILPRLQEFSEGDLLTQHVTAITKHYQEVRFGRFQFTETIQAQVESHLKAIEKLLQAETEQDE